MASACIVVETRQIDAIPIAAARGQRPSTDVAVAGVVTVASGTFDEGFALEDGSGGIYVIRTPGIAVKLGDRVRVSGKIIAPNNQIAISPGRIELLETAAAPLPLEVGTGIIGPATEGRLIAVNGRIVSEVEGDLPWGWKIYLNDGSGSLLVFVATNTGIDVSGIHAGQQLRVVGFNGRYEKHTELLPRTQGDMGIVSETRNP
jgi:hypothetical protein